MSNKPTIFFLPGAWHSASCWDSVRQVLHEKKFETSAIDLPLNGPKSLSDNAFQRDVQAIQTRLHTLIEMEDRDVLLVMHSYSGCCGSEALKDVVYEKEPRRRVGDRGGIVGLVYCTAFMLPAGMAGLEYVFGINEGGGTKVEMKNGLSFCANPFDCFYHDLSEEDAQSAVEDIVPCDANAFGTNKVSYSAYADYPTTYIVCENDRSLLPSTQRWSINRAKEDGIEVKTMSIDSGHMPMLKDPVRLAQCIEEVVVGLTGGSS